MGRNYARKEVRDIVRQLERQGWSCTWTSKGHIRVYNPDGQFVCGMAGTPGRSGMSITKSVLRKHGLDIS
jgi:hypothetical protein